MAAASSKCSRRRALGAMRRSGSRCALLLSFLLLSCAKDTPRRQKALIPPVRGDRVVVEQTAASFYEARVLEVSGQSLRLQTDDGELVHAQMGDVYRLSGTAAGLRPGALAICQRSRGQWVGCRIESSSAHAVSASDATGGHLELDQSQLLVPTAVTLLNLEHHFGAVRQEAEFESAFRRAGRPVAFPGWRPSPNEKIVARLDDQWFSAKVHEITEDALYVAWATDNRVTELARDDVVPQPAPDTVIARGSYGLLRPSGPAQAWLPIRVLSGPDDELTIADAAGRRRHARARDILPLANP